VNEKRLKEVSGVSSDEFEALAVLTAEQKAYLKTLANLGGHGAYASNDVEKLARTTYGVAFNEKNLPKQVLYPLEEAGYVTLKRGTKAKGRGAKPFLVTPTERLHSDVVVPLLEQIEQQILPDLRPFLRRPLDEIIDELDADSKHVRGLALEALALRLMRLVDLTYVATRLRGAATGGAEVDVIFESARLVYSRWQVQCKNKKQVALDDVAKEVGLTHFLKSNVIVIVGTGTISTAARRYANKVMMDSNLCVVMVDGEDVSTIRENPTTIVDVFNREARSAMRLKTLDFGDEQSN